MIQGNDQKNLPVISILIVNYNGTRFLRACLDSIQQHVTVPFEVVIVDNSSQDGSVEFLKKNYPQVQLIQSPKNLGFAAGNNLAASHAKGKYLLLLNNDTQIQKPIQKLVDKLESESRIGVLGCQLMYADGRPQESVGYQPSVMNLVLSWLPLAKQFPDVRFIRRLVRNDSSLYCSPCVEVDWVSGAFLLTRRDLWEKLAGMDEAYFMYMEDVDYCLRVWKAGYQVWYSNQCSVLHYEGAGKSWIGKKAVLDTIHSYLIYGIKFFNPMAIFFLRVFLSLILILRSLCHAFVGLVASKKNESEKAKAYWVAATRLSLNKGF